MSCLNLYGNTEEFFDYFFKTLKDNINRWNYFVNWNKVRENLRKIEKELHLLDYLIGKENLEDELKSLISEYPKVARAIPYLIALRKNKIQLLTDIKSFKYKDFNFGKKKYSEEEIDRIVEFFVKCGLKEVFQTEIKNVADYVFGVEVGLDSNGRKNRTGKLMENIVEFFIRDITKELNADFISQADREKIKKEWNLEIKLDKADRRIDFAILYQGTLFFIEVNFYSGGGSKLKATAGEYIEMSKFWKEQGIIFIWITDGKGWLSAKAPLIEYFEKSNYLLNLEMLKEGCLKEVILKETKNLV